MDPKLRKPRRTDPPSRSPRSASRATPPASSAHGCAPSVSSPRLPAPGDAVRSDRRTIALGAYRSRDVDPAPRVGRPRSDRCGSGRRERCL